MKITKKDIMDDKINELANGRESITHDEIADLDIPFDNKVWVLVRLMTPKMRCQYARRVALDVAHLIPAQSVRYNSSSSYVTRSAWAANRAAREAALADDESELSFWTTRCAIWAARAACVMEAIYLQWAIDACTGEVK